MAVKGLIIRMDMEDMFYEFLSDALTKIIYYISYKSII